MLHVGPAWSVCSTRETGLREARGSGPSRDRHHRGCLGGPERKSQSAGSRVLRDRCSGWANRVETPIVLTRAGVQPRVVLSSGFAEVPRFRLGRGPGTDEIDDSCQVVDLSSLRDFPVAGQCAQEGPAQVDGIV